MSVAIRKIHRRAMVPLDVAVVVFFTVGFLFGAGTVMLLAGLTAKL